VNIRTLHFFSTINRVCTTPAPHTRRLDIPFIFMQNTIHALLDKVYLACIWASGIAIILMSIIIPVGVFARYVLGFGAQWPEPIAIMLMVIFTFLGAAASYRAGAHIAVALVTDRLPSAVQTICKHLMDVLMVAVCLFTVVYGSSLCLETMGQTLAELPWLPVGITYAPLPLGGFLTLLFVVEKMLFGSQHARSVVTFDHALEESSATVEGK
jgi:TRAP-type C4-dicarboxylate transport system permease small subunit